MFVCIFYFMFFGISVLLRKVTVFKLQNLGLIVTVDKANYSLKLLLASFRHWRISAFLDRSLTSYHEQHVIQLLRNSGLFPPLLIGRATISCLFNWVFCFLCIEDPLTGENYQNCCLCVTKWTLKTQTVGLTLTMSCQYNNSLIVNSLSNLGSRFSF